MDTIIYVREPTVEPIYESILGEWYYLDQDGIIYYGNTPGQCYAQTAEGARGTAAHWNRCDKHWANEPRHYRDDEQGGVS